MFDKKRKNFIFKSVVEFNGLMNLCITFIFFTLKTVILFQY
jgi:hypothetical protein